ncbi:Beta-hexosaminidase [Rhodobacteraceae bacterium THAF1]|uniref:glycoside hydrolase family 3 N-terminal domain-containing protein n=1 Tax=Palleronia sp. THAF1 TaxID=2587842 RepID=UPI000F3F9D0A|nr:glycoside hydrolase family 3 protein [Palleronia sp. THAF1]QFU08186.1 Beta-hexosaminidase [Palleronia sp. THAF1]VDC28739.1 Beta-hexosaminidase [Rhodobacteraceae bacterium THAF1]
MTSAAILGCAGTTLGRGEAAFFAEADPWGFILFGRNVEDPDQLLRLTDALRDAVGWRAPILIDQEGGRVQRLKAPRWRSWPPPLTHADTAADPVRAMWLRARLQAMELQAVGIDVNCAPTCDVARPETHPFLRNRCFGRDPETVTANARATAEGLLAGGVLPVMKHMPGHGRAQVDSHKDLPRVDADKTALEADFAPFRALSDLPMGMTAHITYTALGGKPATQDAGLIWLIREEIGFDGLLMTDDISMEALGGSIPDRAAASIEAGCDVVLHCNGNRAEMEGCIDACGPMTDAAARRAEAALARRRLPELADPERLAFELSELDGNLSG